MTKTELCPWRFCSFCGVLTDADADVCPQENSFNNGKHDLQEILLTTEHLTEFLEAGKVIARHHNHPQIIAAMKVKKIR